MTAAHASREIGTAPCGSGTRLRRPRGQGLLPAFKRGQSEAAHGPTVQCCRSAAWQLKRRTCLARSRSRHQCTATDVVSGVDGSCTASVSGGTTNGVGSFTYTARVADLAGNVTAQKVTYHVVYAWNGFAQPVNDTAHRSVLPQASSRPAALSRCASRWATRRGRSLYRRPLPSGSCQSKAARCPHRSTSRCTSTQPTAGRCTEPQAALGTTTGPPRAWAARSGRLGFAVDDGTTHYVTVGLQ